VLGHKCAHALHGLNGYAPANPQAADELAIVHGAPSERRFSHADAATVVGDLT
jgi:hypothetical protein